MFKSKVPGLCSAFLLISTASTADAALLSRLDGQAFYDNILDITWLADANLAASNTFGVSDITADGKMSWDTANLWIEGMNAYNGTGYLGFNDWRMPTLIDSGAPGCDFAYSGTDCGFNPDTSTGEMASLFYDTLGNTSYYDPSGVIQLDYGLVNTADFINFQSSPYWYGTEYAVDTNYAWFFNFIYGGQLTNPDLDKSVSLNVLAVRSGDITAVPVPAAIWLFGTGLISLFGLMGYRKK